ncbi:DUF3352 domain-containing protein [uncultured Treponema sp.]|uniref:DUF3352 domain-containing protein n=1 Tax=uncultured Treponema sp. TaxID=162155 RepID=UPI0025CBB534|nr:DUF3352 domain-containing protein [uncultured Treponema sp.]
MDNIEKQLDAKKTQKNRIISFIFSIVVALLVIILTLACIFSFCAFDKKSALSSIPRGYSLYVSSRSAFDTVNPLFDLQACDVILSSPEFAGIRKPFMEFKSSEIREDFLFKMLASRPFDFALYGNGADIGTNSHFVFVADMGAFSLFSRCIQYMYPKLNLQIENLSYEVESDVPLFVYEVALQNNENQKSSGIKKIYIKSVKNLIIASDSLEHLLTASLAKNDSSYTKEQIKLFESNKSKKSRGELSIVADAQTFLQSVTEENKILSSIATMISEDSLTFINFNITDSDVYLKSSIPLNISDVNNQALGSLLSRKSNVPSLLPRFSDVTQYYTILNAGNLEELKNAILPLLQDVENPQLLWENCEEWSKSILGMDLSEFLFSWTAHEFAVLGVENQNDPVFVLQIKDEKARQRVFNKLTSSILINDDNSLILDGVRIPKLQLPPFFNGLLSLIGINIPSPYFMVLDGYIYFSESEECLSAIYTNTHSGKPLIKNKNYLDVSGNHKKESTLSLYYNLERSVPFFLRSKEIISSVLKLYTMGQLDIRIDKGFMDVSLHACARKSGNLYSVAGFPLNLEGKADSENLQIDSGKNPRHVYWVENSKQIKALDFSGMTVFSKEESDSVEIIASAKNKGDAALWSVSSRGVVSLLSPTLNVHERFPILLGENVSTRPCVVGEKLVVLSENGNVFIIKPDASVVSIEIPGLSSKTGLSSLPDSDCFALYSKGFLGKIYYFEGDKCVNLDSPFEIPGIAFGAPALMKSGGKVYIALITQAGEMNVWRSDSRDGEQTDSFPIRIGGVFMTNVVASDKYFYALSNDAVLYRISRDGVVLSVQIPNSTAKEGYLCLRDPEKNGKMNVYVCADANVIYAFNEKLELLSGYPLTGWGKPVFADVNGDKVSDCIALTIDRKLVAWKTR